MAHVLHSNNKQITIPTEQWLQNTFDSNSWVILSAIEQSIKVKIKKYGTPLRDWDIKINRGVLTGCNEAFIITTAKREEILANCKTKDERKRTDEIIRPYLSNYPNTSRKKPLNLLSAVLGTNTKKAKLRLYCAVEPNFRSVPM